MLSRSEEDHIKAVHALTEENSNASTSDMAERLGIKASSVTVMLKKLAEKGLMKHTPYHGVQLTSKGRTAALKLVRKHRLWETFLVERLGFGWDEVHDVAEQLEHVSSDKLTNNLDEYLGKPQFDPHGDPIPDSQGRVKTRTLRSMTTCAVGERVRIAAVKDPSDQLLHLLDQKGIGIGMIFQIEAQLAFDGSVELRSKQGPTYTLSALVADQLQVEPAKA
ncbi:MAG: metal-dependent transcriptional regulator [Flavobacteriales bacterium]|nr:metal-dependent transcriptional regulator [Flavobacteriales bacterium]